MDQTSTVPILKNHGSYAHFLSISRACEFSEDNKALPYHLALLSILVSGVNAQVNPCVICRNVATACDDLAPFASTEVYVTCFGRQRHKSIQYLFPDYTFASAMFISAFLLTRNITYAGASSPLHRRYVTCLGRKRQE